MTDHDIIQALRVWRGRLAPVQMAEYLGEMADGGLSQGTMIMFFSRSFPDIPLQVLLDAGGWQRLSNGGLTDADFNALLLPWLGAR